MTVIKSMDLVEAVREHLAKASPDVLQELVESFANALMSTEADAVCGAPYGEASLKRVNRQNGYRDRPFRHQGRQHRALDLKAQDWELLTRGFFSAEGGPRQPSPPWWRLATYSGSPQDPLRLWLKGLYAIRRGERPRILVVGRVSHLTSECSKRPTR